MRAPTRTARQLLDQAMSEDALENAVVGLAERGGWLKHHTRPAWSAKGYRTPIRGDTGFPDWVFAREATEAHSAGLLFVELKREKDGTAVPRKRKQAAWQAALEAGGGQVYVWRPSDLSNGTVEAVLLS